MLTRVCLSLGARRRHMRSAMSRLDVMYHQSYGAHRHLPSSAAAAAVAFKAAHFHRQQQQRKQCSNRMREAADVCAQGRQTQGEGRGGGEEPHPTEAEYLSSRCVLFTYFQGDIGDVVDEHFSRALSQASVSRASRALQREGGALASGQCGGFPSSLWGAGYSSLRPDLSPSDAVVWAGHTLPQPGRAPPTTPADPWSYPLGAGYAHVHEVYPHVHARHAHHHMLHPQNPALDPHFGALLLPRVHRTGSPAPHPKGGGFEPDTATHSWPASFHRSVDVSESGLDQEKTKQPAWF